MVFRMLLSQVYIGLVIFVALTSARFISLVPLSCTQEGKHFLQYDTTCNTDCSQKPPRIPGDKTYFNCSIRELKDATDGYKTSIMAQESERTDSPLFDAPTLNSINLALKNFTDVYSINIRFSLPRGKYRPTWSLPKAVLMTFQSIKESEFQDYHYFRCPREILFQFWDYKPTTSYDIEHARTLPFDCLMVKDDFKETLVYNLTLQTANGRSADYILTVPVRRREKQLWKPTIATHLDKRMRAIDVVIEKPSDWQISDCVVHLKNLFDGTMFIKKLKKDCERAAFANVTYGNYSVEVVYEGPCTRNRTCVNMTSYVINGMDLPNLKSAKKDTVESHRNLYIAVTSVGCLLVAIFLTCIIICRRNKLLPKTNDNVQEFPVTCDISDDQQSTSEETRVKEMDFTVAENITSSDTENLNQPQHPTPLEYLCQPSRVSDTRNDQTDEYIITPAVRSMYLQIKQINLSDDSLLKQPFI